MVSPGRPPAPVEVRPLFAGIRGVPTPMGIGAQLMFGNAVMKYPGEGDDSPESGLFKTNPLRYTPAP